MTNVIVVLLMGLLVGALGRLVIPGPNPMGLLATIAIGVGGSILGGLIGGLIFDSAWGIFLMAIVCAGVIVWLVERVRAPAR